MTNLNEQLNTWPEEIWLNTGDYEQLAAFDEYAEVSWCSEPKGPADVRYVREDRAPAAAPAPVAASDELTECKRFLEDMHSMPVDWTIKESQTLHAKVNAALVQELTATPASSTADAKDAALAQFTAYVVKNYPADTIIVDPNWHAPRLFRAALAAITSSAGEVKGGGNA